MIKKIFVLFVSYYLVGCSSIDSVVLSKIIPVSYEYTVVKEESERAYLFGDPPSFYVLEFNDSISSGPNSIFNANKFDLADIADRTYFIKRTLSKYGETASEGSSLFRADICSDYSSNQCGIKVGTYSVYLLVEKTGKKAFIEVVSF